MKICIFIVYFINFYLISSFKLSKSIDKSDNLSISLAKFDKKTCHDIKKYNLSMKKYQSRLKKFNNLLLNKQRKSNNFLLDKQNLELNFFINKAGLIIFSNDRLISWLLIYFNKYCYKYSFKYKINRLFNRRPKLSNTIKYEKN